MYPKPFLDLSGWMPRVFSAGAVTFALCSEARRGAAPRLARAASISSHAAGSPDPLAQTSTITWGGASYGELGYGPTGKKSSANPDKVPSLEGLKVLSVACGAGHTLFLADAAADVSKLPAWNPPKDAALPPPEEDAKGAGRKRKPAAEGGAAKKR